MELDLTGRTAVVTGASRGLGRDVAIALATHGANVVLCARDPRALAESVECIENRDVRVLAIAADISSPDDVANLHEQTCTELSSPSILVNAAGIFGPIALVRDSDPTRWIETLLINTAGPYLTCRAFVGAMVDQGWGRIVNVSSAAPFYPPGPINSAYSTSKAALNQFTRHLAAEVDGTGVTANVLHPGSLKTAMWADIREEARSAGPGADGLRTWVETVDRTGGDSIQEAVRLILSLVDPTSDTNGAFCWPEGMHVSDPLPSW